MFLIVDNILSTTELARLRRELDALPWENGERTAGSWGRTRKRNTQLVESEFVEQRKAILDKLMYQPRVQAAVHPAKAVAPLINRYQPGDRYDWHNDNPMQSGVRSDLSYTLFLSAPDEYEGGELTIELAHTEQAFKLPAGSVVFYPSGHLHAVKEITRGTRLAAVGWVQSLIRDPSQRELLLGIRDCLEELHAQDPEGKPFRRLTSIEAQLVRKWAEPV